MRQLCLQALDYFWLRVHLGPDPLLQNQLGSQAEPQTPQLLFLIDEAVDDLWLKFLLELLLAELLDVVTPAPVTFRLIVAGLKHLEVVL